MFTGITWVAVRLDKWHQKLYVTIKELFVPNFFFYKHHKIILIPFNFFSLTIHHVLVSFNLILLPQSHYSGKQFLITLVFIVLFYHPLLQTMTLNTISALSSWKKKKKKGRKHFIFGNTCQALFWSARSPETKLSFARANYKHLGLREPK